MEKEKFQQEKAVSDIALQREQMALDAQKKQEAWLNEPMDITTHPTFMSLSQETQNKVKQDFVAQKITDPNGRGTRRDILKQVEMMEKTPKILDQYLTVEMNSRHNEVLKANEVLQKKLLEKDAKPQDVQKLQDAFDMANQKYTGLLKNRKDYMDAMEWKASIDATTGEIKRLQSEGKLGEIPESVKQSMFMSLKTGDLKSVNEILKEWSKSELKPTPEPKKWPQTREEVLELEKEKARLKHEATKEKTSKENGELKSARFNNAKKLLDEAYANLVGSDVSEVHKRMSPEQTAAYNRILITTERNLAKMEPAQAINEAIKEFWKGKEKTKPKGERKPLSSFEKK